MKLSFIPLKQLIPKFFFAQGKHEFLFQRLFWGVIFGCLATIPLIDSPYLDNLESHMLEWRYKLAKNSFQQNANDPTNFAKDISLIKFDDQSQFELGIARFNDLHSQNILAKVIENVERYSPKLIVLDIDLRGSSSPTLIEVFKRYHNIVLALFGNLEGNSSLPSAVYMTKAVAVGYDEIVSDASGRARKLPINYKGLSTSTSKAEQNTLVPVSSLTEAVLEQVRKNRADANFKLDKQEAPLYFSFLNKNYQSISLVETIKQLVNPERLKNKIVIFGDVLTPRQTEKNLPKEYKSTLYLHADAISTLLENQQLYTYATDSVKTTIIVMGGIFCGLAAVLSYIPRTCIFVLEISILLIFSMLCFEEFHIIIPTASPLAVLILSYVIGSFINLNSNLTKRNHELADARKAMQMRAEDERQRIAEDLHDETLPNLSAVARMADKLSKELSNNPAPSQIRERLDFAINEMRRVINDLHPSVLETMGFAPAIDNLLAALARDSNIQGKFLNSASNSIEALPKFYKLQLYRILQECLNNIVKHAQARNIEIKMTEKENKLIVSVTDDGIGMSPYSAHKASHGLLNIRQRAQMIGAKVEWNKSSNTSSGTKVLLQLPLHDTVGEG